MYLVTSTIDMEEHNISYDPSSNSEEFHRLLNNNYSSLLNKMEGNSDGDNRLETAEQTSCSLDYVSARSSSADLGQNRFVAANNSVSQPLRDSDERYNELSDTNSNRSGTSISDDAIVSSHEIPKIDYPPEYQEGQYDVVFIYSEHDVKQALTLKELFEKFFILDNGEPVSVCVLDGNYNLRWIQSRFSHLEEALLRSTYMFLFITEHFVNDQWADLQKDECLMESLENLKKRWCVVPIFLQPKREVKFKLPSGLRALKGVDISRLLPGRDICNVDVEELTIKDLDKHIVNNLKIMLNERLSMKKVREADQQKRLDEWKKDEIMIRQKQREVDQEYQRQRELERQKMVLDVEVEARRNLQSTVGRTNVPRVTSGPQGVIYNFGEVQHVTISSHDPSSHKVKPNPNQPMEEPADDTTSCNIQYDVEVSSEPSLNEYRGHPVTNPSKTVADARVFTKQPSETVQSPSFCAEQHLVPSSQRYQHNEGEKTEQSKPLPQLPAAMAGIPPSHPDPRYQTSIGTSGVIRGQFVGATTHDRDLLALSANSEALLSQVYMDRQNSSLPRPVGMVIPSQRSAAVPPKQASLPDPARIYPAGPDPSDETTLKQPVHSPPSISDETSLKTVYTITPVVASEPVPAITDHVTVNPDEDHETVPKQPFVALPSACENTQQQNVFIKSENSHMTSTLSPVMSNPVNHVTDTVSSLNHSPVIGPMLPKPLTDHVVSRPVNYSDGNLSHSTMGSLLSEQPTLIPTIAQTVTSSMTPPMMSSPSKTEAHHVDSNSLKPDHVMSRPDPSGDGRSTSLVLPSVSLPIKPVTADQQDFLFSQSLNSASSDVNTSRPHQSVIPDDNSQCRAQNHDMLEAAELKYTSNTTGGSNKDCKERIKRSDAVSSTDISTDDERSDTLGNQLSRHCSALVQGTSETPKKIANTKKISETNREYEMAVFNTDKGDALSVDPKLPNRIHQQRSENEIVRSSFVNDPRDRKRDPKSDKTEAEKSKRCSANSSGKESLASDQTSASTRSDQEESETTSNSGSGSPKSDSRKYGPFTFFKAFWK